MSNVQPKPSWQATQAKFAAYIRDPNNNSCPADINKQRMDTYRELFFNNVDSFLSSNFPVIHHILSEQQWFELVQDFFDHHRCTTPIFAEIPEEFIDFLQQERRNQQDYPFLIELAHYEWVEMALTIAQQPSVIPPSTTDTIQQLSAQHIALSELAWPLAYQFPVHKISPSFLPTIPPEQPTYLVVYRDIEDEVHFLEINALTFRLLQLLQEQPHQKTEAYLQKIVEETQHPSPRIMVTGGLQTLQELAGKSVVVISSE